MTIERPHITADLLLVSYMAHPIRKTTILNPGAVAKLTGTSKRYWRRLRSKGIGPRFHEEQGCIWYVLADLQDWLGLVVHIEPGADHV
jgi:hypothetical protein